MAYNPRKASQIIAFFALKTGNNAINVLKAVKLVYLADRENIACHGYPILDERRVSMKNGPVNSTTYDYIKGEIHPDYDAGWSEFVSDRANHDVGLNKAGLTADDLDELSDAELDTLEAVWEQFGGFDQWQLEKFTHVHGNIPEWEDPKVTGINSKTIPLEAMLAALGVPSHSEHASELESVSNATAFLKGL